MCEHDADKNQTQKTTRSAEALFSSEWDKKLCCSQQVGGILCHNCTSFNNNEKPLASSNKPEGIGSLGYINYALWMHLQTVSTVNETASWASSKCEVCASMHNPTSDNQKRQKKNSVAWRTSRHTHTCTNAYKRAPVTTHSNGKIAGVATWTGTYLFAKRLIAN